ncbi:hypothetical protein JCGZ_09603 [Jatropha curcas]|uniref:Uncharacterized protein n=1 Tax=Jatropha curcas TaxID=180498 RepID=A0A067LLT6_JATCU|nr:hypothetical protein JCGZ_09603 [Jatropha curcas]
MDSSMKNEWGGVKNGPFWASAIFRPPCTTATAAVRRSAGDTPARHQNGRILLFSCRLWIHRPIFGRLATYRRRQHTGRNHVDKTMSRHRIADLLPVQFDTPATGR